MEKKMQRLSLSVDELYLIERTFDKMAATIYKNIFELLKARAAEQGDKLGTDLIEQNIEEHTVTLSIVNSIRQKCERLRKG